VHLHYLKQDFEAITKLATIHSDITDPWTAYRIGEAHEQKSEPKLSLPYFKKAVELQALNLDFQNKLANNYFALGNILESEKHYQIVLSESSSNVAAMNNLAYIKLRKGQLKTAEALVDKALALNPDYVQALLNKAAIAKIRQQDDLVESVAKRILELEAENEKALELLQVYN